jgi:hypothetical protein
MSRPIASLLNRCLGSKSPRKELLTASLGCVIGSTLILLALQIFTDSKLLVGNREVGQNFVTLNKSVQGGILLNLGKQEKSFREEEIDRIKKLPGVKKIGDFTRNQFPVTIHIWPAGKIGLGAAARTDLFFESVPDEFLDQKPEAWKWEENQSYVPIMVPKFYLDLWNFGLAPSRSEYPALSREAASSMPIEILIGEDESFRMLGRFVAFSKRINSVLVPANFLQWANLTHGNDRSEKYFFVWKNEEIIGAPVSRSNLAKNEVLRSTDIQVSPIEHPEDRMILSDALNMSPSDGGPSRLILAMDKSPTDDFLQSLDELGYETNREFPQDEWLNQLANGLIWCMAGVGSLLSLLSIATFASSFRLVVTQSAETTRDLIHLGFSPLKIYRVFMLRFAKIFTFIWALSLIICYVLKIYTAQQLKIYGIELSNALSWQTLAGAILYAVVFLWINQLVIARSVRSCS